MKKKNSEVSVSDALTMAADAMTMAANRLREYADGLKRLGLDTSLDVLGTASGEATEMAAAFDMMAEGLRPEGKTFTIDVPILPDESLTQ